MITNPPPNDSAPTLNATHATEASTPALSVAGNSGASTGTIVGRRQEIPRSASSSAPQPSRTSTSQDPMVAEAAPPASR